MVRGLRELALALIGERRVVVRVGEIRFQLNRPGEARNGGAPIARLGGAEAELIMPERVARIGFDRFARQLDRASGIVGDQRFARFADQAPRRLLVRA